MKHFLILLLSVVGGPLGWSQTAAVCTFTKESISVDGELNEGVWKRAKSLGFSAADAPFQWKSNGQLDRFIQQYPYDTSKAETQTRFAMAFDEKFIYAIFICENRNPEKPYVIQSLKRDFSVTNTDAVVLTLSPFNDGQNGFSFGVTPFNSQREGSVENGGGFGVTTAWDQVWFSATKRYGNFWVAEMAIPFNSLRFNPAKSVWRFNVSRFDFKNNEISAYARVPRNFNISSLVFCDSMAFVSSVEKAETVSDPSGIEVQGPSLGLTHLVNKNKNVVFIPYVSGIGQQGQTGKRSTLQDPVTATPKLGFDAKVALSRSLNLDVTVNPDFAQVDVDVQQVNLTRYSLFFPERRQFFIENSDLFASFGFRQIRPFFSRRIGLGSQGAVPILGGVRMSGKIGSDVRLGLMNITTQSQDLGGINGALPATNYSVFALQRKVFAASNLAFIAVHDQRINSLVSYVDRHGNWMKTGDYNTVLGTEFNLLTKSNLWAGKGFVQKSLYPGLRGDAGFAHATWLRYRSLNWMAMWNHEYVSKHFSARTGFVPRTDNFDPISGKIIKYDYWRLEPMLSYSIYPKRNNLVNHYGFVLSNSSYYDSSFHGTESESELGVDVNFQNSSMFHVSFDHSYYDLFLPFDPLERGQYFFGKYERTGIHAEYTTNNRKPLSAFIEAMYGGYFIGNKYEFNGNLSYRVKSVGKQKLPLLLFTANFNHINIIMGDSFKSAINLIGFKTEYTINTNTYFTGFVQYNTQTEKANLNLRFQWRYRPMSDFFLVYSQNYDQFQSVLPNRNMYFGPSFRSLAAKWVCWFN
jgi:hypothetical protein